MFGKEQGCRAIASSFIPMDKKNSLIKIELKFYKYFKNLTIKTLGERKIHFKYPEFLSQQMGGRIYLSTSLFKFHLMSNLTCSQFKHLSWSYFQTFSSGSPSCLATCASPSLKLKIYKFYVMAAEGGYSPPPPSPLKK